MALFSTEVNRPPATGTGCLVRCRGRRLTSALLTSPSPPPGSLQPAKLLFYEFCISGEPFHLHWQFAIVSKQIRYFLQLPTSLDSFVEIFSHPGLLRLPSPCPGTFSKFLLLSSLNLQSWFLTREIPTRLNLGISILYIPPRSAPPSLLAFLDPFTTDVYIYTLLVFVLVTLIIYVLARFSPNQWEEPPNCQKDPEEYENQYTFLNSFWFTLGALMQQGSDVAPIALCVRFAAGMWFFFALIMIANLKRIKVGI